MIAASPYLSMHRELYQLYYSSIFFVTWAILKEKKDSASFNDFPLVS